MAETDESLTYRQFDEQTNQMAHFIRDTGGVGQGERIAVMFENSLGSVVVQGAGERTGVYYTLINYHLTADEAAYIINDSDSKIVVVSACVAEVARQLPAVPPRWNGG